MSEIKVVAWNARGCNSALRVRLITEFVRKCNISVIGILESKIKQHREIDVSSRLLPGWSYCTNSTAIERGRIWLSWNQDIVDVSTIQCASQFIHCRIKSRDASVQCLATFVYGSNDVTRRISLWDGITSIVSGVTDPWVMLGDVNCILDLSDKNSFNRNPHDSDRGLNEFASRNGLADHPFSGIHYTWSNNQLGVNRIACKLDRVMTNAEWGAAFPDSQVVFGDPLFSVHSPGIFTINPCVRRRTIPFKFRNFWVDEPDFLNVVEVAWNVPVEGNPQFILASKLKHLKHTLSKWQKGRFRHLETMRENSLDSLKLANVALQRDFSNVRLQEDVFSARQLFERRTNQLHSYIAQKTKLDWIKLGEENSALFYNGLKLRGGRNSIFLLKDRNDQLLDNRESISNEIVGFFSQLFGSFVETRSVDVSELEGTVIDYACHSGLCREVTENEIFGAVSDIGVKKSPGPDGFGSKLFKSCWLLIKWDVIDAVRDFFRRSRLLRQVNATFINLIPKVDSPLLVREFRPISCCNTMLKLISKILVSRIRPLLKDIISANQGAFVPGRNIVDNLAVAQDLVKGYDGKYSSPRCMIQIDLQKAYDCVSWKFLWSALEYFQFPMRIIGWIMECVSTPSFSIILNGEVEGFFQGKRGLRQGDPLSPYLFVLVMEMLTRKLEVACSEKGFYFHPRCKQLGLHSLIFADDLLIFCKPVRSSLVIVKKVLGEFADESGLVANGCKSQVFFGGVARLAQVDMAEALGVRLGTLPVRYLGVPLHSKRLRPGDFQPLLNSVQKAISTRQARHISYVGRCQIIKSVLESIVRFWMQVFSLPKYVTRRITSMCRSYLWCGVVDHRKSPVAWARVCRDKDEGGLGFKELLAWNRALLFRLVFVIYSGQQNIWVSWARANLTRGDTWMSPARAGSSCIWRAAVHARDMVLGKLNGVIPATARLTGSNGKYDTMKVYSWLHPPGPILNWCGVIWHGIQARKWAFTCWMATLNRLPTKTRLYKWGLVADVNCALCGNANEDVQHLWCECDVVRDISTRVLDWVGIQARYGTLLEWWDWFSSTTKRKNNGYLSRLLAVMSIVYFTWKLRNDVIYNGRQIDTVRVSREIIDSCRVRMIVKLRFKGRRGRALMKRLFQN